MSRRSKRKEMYETRAPMPLVMVGGGGIGSHFLPLLVRVGFTKTTVYDSDRVMPVNLQMQNFDAGDVGRNKAHVLRRTALRINPDATVVAKGRKFTQGDTLDGVVVSAVDSMQSRQLIFDQVERDKERVPLFIDGRFGRGEFTDFIDIYCIDPKSEEEVAAYREWLFTDDEAQHAPRSEKITAYVPYGLSFVVGRLFTQWLETGRHPWKVTVDSITLHIEQYFMENQKTEGK